MYLRDTDPFKIVYISRASMSPRLLEKLIFECRKGSQDVLIGRKVSRCAADSLHIFGGEKEIKEIIGRMEIAAFTPVPDWKAYRIFESHPARPLLENYNFEYLNAKAFLSFFPMLQEDAKGKWQELPGFIIKSFHRDMYKCA